MNDTSKLSELLKLVNEETGTKLPEQSHTPTLAAEDELIDMSKDFDFNDYQVVRREFFAHIKEPAVSFYDCKLYVNTACITKFANSNYAQVLVNQKNKIMALRPCEENEKDSFMWCSVNKDKRKPKSITCKIFFAKIVSLMGWDPKYRYRLLGKLIHANGEYLIAFDLVAAETYKRIFPEGAKPKVSRTPVFPSDWQNQFGVPWGEHRQSMQINIFDGYAVYSVKETVQPDDSCENNTNVEDNNNV